jgi:hypothetical protein
MALVRREADVFKMNSGEKGLPAAEARQSSIRGKPKKNLELFGLSL